MRVLPIEEIRKIRKNLDTEFRKQFSILWGSGVRDSLMNSTILRVTQISPEGQFVPCVRLLLLFAIVAETAGAKASAA
jgi:hypothetical protein